jgi:hypothetical protein
MNKDIKIALVGGLFAILGAIAGAATTGWSQIELARQKFNSDLVMKALESNSPDERLESLNLLVETNLLQDTQVRQGVRVYAETKRKNPSSIPQVMTSPHIEAPIIPNPRIYLLTGNKTKESLFSEYNKSLSQAGYKVLGSKVLDDQGRPSYEEVRYFHPQDKAQADKIAEVISFELKSSKVEAKQYSDSSARPGYIEIWFGK